MYYIHMSISIYQSTPQYISFYVNHANPNPHQLVLLAPGLRLTSSCRDAERRVYNQLAIGLTLIHSASAQLEPDTESELRGVASHICIYIYIYVYR